MASYYLICTCDPGVAYVAGNRLFNLRVEEHGDHLHCDLSIHIVKRGLHLGGGRYLPVVQRRDFGACRFRLPVSDGQYHPNFLMRLIESDPFQELALGPLDDLAGCFDPGRFGMLPD